MIPLFQEQTTLPENRYETRPLLKAALLIFCLFSVLCITYVMFLSPPTCLIIKVVIIVLSLIPFRILYSTVKYYSLSKDTKGRTIRISDNVITFEEINVSPHENANRPLKNTTLTIPLDDCFWREGYRENDSVYGTSQYRFIMKEKAIEICFYNKNKEIFQVYTCGYSPAAYGELRDIFQERNVKKWPRGTRFSPLISYLFFSVGIYISAFLFWPLLNGLGNNNYCCRLAIAINFCIPLLMVYCSRRLCHDYLYANIRSKSIILFILTILLSPLVRHR